MNYSKEQPTFLVGLASAISVTRLQAFQKADDEREALARYLWNIALCEAYYPVFHLLEVGFRNALHREIGQYVLCESWLSQPPAFLRRRELEAIQSAELSLKCSHKPIDEPRLVAELSFGFWTSLLDVHYDQLWHQIISRSFPLMPRTLRTRSHLSSMVQPIRRLRNLAFHHHAIWDRDDLGITHTSAATIIGWISSPLAASLGRIDRFPAVLSAGLAPYREHANNLIPN
jgi:hypothetical protein